MLNTVVLVLNQNYEPLNVCHLRRAVVLIYQGKAEILEHDDGVICTPSQVFLLPSVIRLLYYIKRPLMRRKLTRREVFVRDHYACQYCGRDGRELTLDHVIPRHRGGKHVWENLVTACIPCNRRKAGRTPGEAGMHLLRHPFQPPANSFYLLGGHLERHDQWQKFIPEWQKAN